MTAEPQCKDCIAEGITTVRPVALDNAGCPVPGKRCVTHHRARRNVRRAAARTRRLSTEYGLTDAEYEAIKVDQDGVCAICQRATGATRNLSVDHDHTTGRVRGLLCRPCNDALGHLRDDPAAIDRMARHVRHGADLVTATVGRVVVAPTTATHGRRRKGRP